MIVDRTQQCDVWREQIASRHDQGVAARVTDDLDEHIDRCGACRAYAADLVTIGEWIRAEPARPLPADALAEIWNRTVGGAVNSSAATIPGRRPRGTAIGLAVAAMITLSAGATLMLGLQERGYSDAELDRIDRELRIAMAHLAGAVASAERITVEDVLIGEASTALQRLPLSTSRVRTSHD